jgi:hypothetical protein
MINIRRIYVYLISAITLQSVVWAIIALMRNLTAGNLAYSTSAIAVQVAMILVGLPLFLVHWLWAQRSAANDQAERASSIRRLYLNAMLIAFIIPIVNSVHLLAETTIEIILRPISRTNLWVAELSFSIIALLITAIMAIYHYRIQKQDDEAVGRDETAVILDQLLTYLLVIVGLILTAFGTAELIRLILSSFSAAELRLGELQAVAASLSLVIAGLPLWIISWRQAQLQFASGDEWEQSSIVRKIMLYLTIFLSSLTAVTTADILLANFLMRLLDVPSTSGGFFNALSIIIVSVVIWAYHALVLQRDAVAAETVGQAAAVRRIYLYLISAVGLTAVIVGTGGILSVLIRALDSATLHPDLREQLAWFTATLIAGLPVWLISWRRIQHLVAGQTPAANEERSAFTRRLYLYFFVFVAILTLLGGAVYVVSQFVELALGSRSTGGLLTDLGQALAYTLIAVAVLIYHAALIRTDQRLITEQEIQERRQLTVAVVDTANGRLGRALVDHLQHKLPGINIHPIPLTSAAGELMPREDQEQSHAEILTAADIIVTPWQLANSLQSDLSDPEISHAFNQSTAQKLILPMPQKGITWIGVEPWQEKAITREVGQAIDSIASGNDPSASRKMSTPAIIIAVLASLLALIIIPPLVITLIAILLDL